MKTVIIKSTLITFLICQLFFHNQLFANEFKTKAVWMFGGSLTIDNKAIVNKMKENSVNEIFLLVKGGAGNKINPENLRNLIKNAHDQSIKVHLWYCVFRDNAFLEANPDAHVYHAPSPSESQHDPYRMNSVWVNPFYPGYKEYVTENIRYFIRNFDCDGIHLDYIRYSHLVYSFDPYSLANAASLGCDTERLLNLFKTPANYEKYAKNTGFIDLYANKDPDVVTWVEMRKNKIYEYIKAIRDIIESTKPCLELTAAFMPEGVTDVNYADVHYAQNYEMNSSLLDVIAPMSYFKGYGKNTDWLEKVTSDAINRVRPECKIYAGIQAYEGVTDTEIDEQIAYAIKGGASGVILFRAETITDEKSWKVIKKRFSK